MGDPVEILFPADQQEGTEAVLATWLKAPGEWMETHEPIAEIETDKVMVEIASPSPGAIREILVPAGAAVIPGDVLCTFDSDGSEEVKATSSILTAGPAGQRLSPAVRHRLTELGLDPSGITGTGRDGRITLSDVETQVLLGPLEPAQEREPKPTQQIENAGKTRQVPHSTTRRRIAANMVKSLMHTAPHVSAVFEADLSAVLRHRAANKATFDNRGTPLTVTAYFVAALVRAIQAVPEVNSRWHEDYLEIFAEVNVGIGTALGDQGLIVPVIHRADKKSLAQIAADLSDLTGRAREGKLLPADVRGGTFTISNHGVSGSLIAAPIIINQPQSAILGVGKIEKRVRVVEIDGHDAIWIVPMCYVSLTIDHRVLDGYQTNAFLTALTQVLETWPA